MKQVKMRRSLIPWVHERNQRGWSQAKLAEELGSDRRSVGRWETGEVFPSAYFREKLCKLFSKNANELGLLREDVDTNPEDMSNELPVVQNIVPSFPSPPLYDIAILPSLIWNVPYRRNPFFTGRDDVLGRLHTILLSGKAAALTQPQAMTGLGGIGKTQTAVEYAYRYRDDYQIVLWVKADSLETLISDFVTVAKLLNLPMKDEEDHNRVVNIVKNRLRDYLNWLLIFDNVEDLTTIRDFISPTDAGHILLTMRAQATGSLAQHIEIEGMEPTEGALFLLRRASLIGPDASLDDTSYANLDKAKDISEEMDGLPLALDQAGAYLEETGCSLSDYLHLFRTRRKELLGRQNLLSPDYPETVATTWSLSFRMIEQADSTAAELLRLCAFLGPDAIPEELFSEGAPEFGDVPGAVAVDLFKLNEAILTLRKYSLLRRNAETKMLSIHRLVQAVIKDAMDEKAQCCWAERAVRIVNRVFPDVTYESRDRCQRLLPLAHMCKSLIEHHQLCFPEAARLLNQTAEYMFYHAFYTRAELLYRSALAIYEQVLGPEYSDTAQTFNDLTVISNAQSQYEQGEPLSQHRLAIFEQVLRPQHLTTTSSLHNLVLL